MRTTTLHGPLRTDHINKTAGGEKAMTTNCSRKKLEMFIPVNGENSFEFENDRPFWHVLKYVIIHCHLNHFCPLKPQKGNHKGEGPGLKN